MNWKTVAVSAGVAVAATLLILHFRKPAMMGGPAQAPGQLVGDPRGATKLAATQVMVGAKAAAQAAKNAQLGDTKAANAETAQKLRAA